MNPHRGRDQYRHRQRRHGLADLPSHDPTGSMSISAQGNNLENNTIGVEIVVQSYTPAANLGVD